MSSSDSARGTFDLAALERIDAICMEFEQRLQDGGRPQLRDYLRVEDQRERRALLEELLGIEFAYRGLPNNQAMDSLCRRFPGDETVVVRAVESAYRGITQLKETRSEFGSVTHDEAELRVPGTFGRYRLIEKLGAGGMGSVYRAEDTSLNREVALKIPRLSEHGCEMLLMRFRREARAAAALQHPNLCRVLDYGFICGRPFLTMERIAGQTLADWVPDGKRLDPSQALNLVRRMALAMHEAHEAGVVHRDLKPANVMIDERNQPVIVDFGLARFAPDVSEPSTQDGTIIGTLPYMSPEQVSGHVRALGPRSDVYSLGTLLYELLVGHPPFRGSSRSLLRKIRFEEPLPPSQACKDLHPSIDDLCLRAMQKQPEHRYASMKELADDIQRVCELDTPLLLLSKAQATRRITQTPSRMPLIVVCSLAVLVMPAIAWKTWDKDPADSMQMAQQTRTENEQQTLSEPNPGFGPSEDAGGIEIEGGADSGFEKINSAPAQGAVPDRAQPPDEQPTEGSVESGQQKPIVERAIHQGREQGSELNNGSSPVLAEEPDVGGDTQTAKNAALSDQQRPQAADSAVPARVAKLIAELQDSGSPARSVTVGLLGRFGPVAVPALTAALKDTDRNVRIGAASALGQIGAAAEAAVPALTEALKDEDANLRVGAAAALGQIGPAAKDAVPALAEALKDEDATVRGRAAAALGKIGPVTKDVVPALIEAFQDPRIDVKRDAAHALASLGPAAQEAVPVLVRALAHRKYWDKASIALAGIGAPAVPALIEALDTRNNVSSGPAAFVLGRIGPAAIPALIEALDHKYFRVRLGAAYALGTVGPAAKDAVPSLLKTLKDKYPRVRSNSASALGAIGPAAKDAVPALVEALKDEDSSVRAGAAGALGGIGPATKDVVTALIEAFKDADPIVSGNAASALGRIGPNARTALPALTDALNGKDDRLRDAAARAMVGIGPAAVPTLIEALEEPDTRHYAASVLGRIGAPAKDAAPSLAAALEQDDVGFRFAAARALEGIGPAAVPFLIGALKAEDSNARVHAVVALGRMGPAAKEAIPALKAMGDNDPADNVRGAVAIALKSIDP